MSWPQLGVDLRLQSLDCRSLPPYPGPGELGLQSRLVLLYRQAQTVRRGQGDALFGEQKVMDEQDGERRCEL